VDAEVGLVDDERRLGEPGDEVGVEGGVGAIGKQRTGLPGQEDADGGGWDVVVGEAALDDERSNRGAVAKVNALGIVGQL
jgi:hypothetical protein